MMGIDALDGGDTGAFLTSDYAAVRAVDSAELCQSDSDDFNRGPR